ncbi:hypothetical protein bcCo53_001700 (plasmid) [Borrelia coriaceae]|uniref:Putative cytosolic protein n=1 Tax=Borrelia coriaceae ATCC 43381 TaxID=1408429 RepID=W5SY58_9SPIR|nr:hypothetical protein [Borrelia coriaceae]AHH11825.1 Putative cytosolic protein [Borrelia coriaceae ATCC 43381]UPA17316.1 hypothetical protein bcCo53_001499 [Borrelia coriaceae]UPA17399.1 hypothetical protein bcCo53_001595 [Borrelia coriaceae]UPA17495.1 hypothetical protein bcCo53_001700 [Borrelia coriaceae]
MNKNVLAICVLTLMCLVSCDINFLDELLGKAREKFLEETDNAEGLNSKEENQEDKENKVDVSKVKRDVVRNKDFREKSINLSQPKLTAVQESYLTGKDAEASEIKKKIDVNLAAVNAIYDELEKSLSELKNMEAFVIRAESDFNEARRGVPGNNHVTNTLPYLDEAIKTVKDSRHVAVVGYNEQFHALKHVKADAEYAKGLIKSALGESAQARLSGYYYVQLMIDNISNAQLSLSKAESMFKKVESELDNLRVERQKADKDFAGLKSAYEALLAVKKK